MPNSSHIQTAQALWISFDESSVAQFAKLSHDVNPLHMDSSYARQTAFGQRVVFGIQGLLACLEHLPVSDDQCIRHLDVSFQNPIFIGPRYQINVNKSQAQLQLCDGEIVLIDVQYALGPKTSVRGNVTPLAAQTTPKNPSTEALEAGIDCRGRYSVGAAINASVIEDVLALSSYLIGMEIPGQNALYSSLSLSFSGPVLNSGVAIDYALNTNLFEPDYGMVCLDFAAHSDADFRVEGELKAFVRKEINPVSSTEIQAMLPDINLNGKVALVIGGSRGLGASFVQALALSGCQTLVNFNRSVRQAEALAKDLASLGSQIKLLPGDASTPEWNDSVLQHIMEEYGRLDILICNACAPPMNYGNSIDGQQRAHAYYDRNLALSLQPMNTFAPLLSEQEGSLFLISSSIVAMDSDQWPSYQELKRDLETLAQDASNNFDYRLVIVRPPALLTHMSNTPIRAMGAIAPEQVALSTLVQWHQSQEKTCCLEAFELPREDPEKRYLAASFTANPILDGLISWEQKRQGNTEFHLAPYHQLFQELKNPSSGLATMADMNCILMRFEDWFREQPALLDDPNRAFAFLHETLDDLLDALRAFNARTNKQGLFLLCPSSPRFTQTLANHLPELENKVIQAFEGLEQWELLIARQEEQRYKIASSGYNAVRDEIGHIPFTDEYFQFLATLITRRNSQLPGIKVIVVDCDNTLWSGVCGEVGPQAVGIIDHYAALQKFLVAQKNKGRLICLCSKNSEEDVRQVFEQREMPLQWSDIVDTRINWLPKSENIRSLAESLNLGLDAFVFIDDNPVECGEVRSRCPEVFTLQWPAEKELGLAHLEHNWLFDSWGQTAEDKKRTELYQANVAREKLRAETHDFQAFLEDLGLKIEIEPVSEEDMARVSQLSMRTNQFNFTTIRRSVAELKALMAKGSQCLTVKVSDRFGNYGLVGVLIYNQTQDMIELDSFMLSCRVLGRGVEHRMLAYLGNLAVDTGIEHVVLTHVETAKNLPAAMFLDSLGEAIHQNDKARQWKLDAAHLSGLRYQVHSDGPAVIQKKKEVQVIPKRKLEAFMDEVVHLSLQKPEPINAVVDTPSQGGQCYDRTLAEVRNIFAKTLKLKPEVIGEKASLETFVKDSFKLVELTVALKKVFEKLPATFLFEHKSLEDITHNLIADHGAFLNDRYNLKHEESNQERETKKFKPKRNLDIAIIGMNGRYPGADHLDELWENLRQGVSTIGPIPDDRWDVSQYYDPNGGPGKSYATSGGFLQNVASFDASFFNISPKEAELMDPQQRLFLEVVWGLLEDAGYTRESISRETAVFVGVNANDYGLYANQAALDGWGAYRNADQYQIPNRVSYYFDFHGPSICIDTACSSSGTGISLACDALAEDRCHSAIIGGMNLFLHPSRFIQYAQMHMISPSGQCAPFGRGADGTIFGEGIGAILLKKREDAVRDGDHIYAVIKGCAVNAGGKTNGFTVPNPKAQAAMIRNALAESGVDPRSISYVEAHGTGTPLGDPIEVRGLTLAYEQQLKELGVEAQQFCRLGSLKANIGHLEAGAAVAGIIKVLLQMKHQTLVPSLNSAEPNEAIIFEETPFQLQAKTEPWRQPEILVKGQPQRQPRRAGVSSFGAGGANFHLILEEFISHQKQDNPGPVLILLSAHRPENLRVYVQQLRQFLVKSPHLSLNHLAYTLQIGRTHMEERLAMVVTHLDELSQKLQAFLAEDFTDVITGAVRSESNEAVELLLQDDDGPQILKRMFARQQWHKLAKLWSTGVNVPWADFYKSSSCQRIPLPHYPFIGNHFWLPEGGKTHPLLDEVAVEHSLGKGLCFRKILKPMMPIIRDHEVLGDTILPGVGYLEMARAAVAQLGKQMLPAQVTWMAPFKVAKAQRELQLRIEEREEGLRFEIGAADANHLCCKGYFRPLENQATEQRIDIASLQEQCSETWEKSRVYHSFENIGVVYGPYFQGIQRIHFGEDQALTELDLGQRYRRELQQYTFHPRLLDGALQTALLLAGHQGKPALPFSLDAIETYHPMSAKCFAYVCGNHQSGFRIAILDEDGRVCLKLDGLILREVKDSFPNMVYQPVWHSVGPVSNQKQTVGEGHVILHPRDCYGFEKALQEALGEACQLISLPQPKPLSQSLKNTKDIWFLGGLVFPNESPQDVRDRSVMMLFDLAKQLQASSQEVHLHLVTNNLYRLFDEENLYPHAAGMVGLAQVIAKECPQIKITTVDIDLSGIRKNASKKRKQDLISPVVQEPENGGKETLVRQKIRYQRQLQPIYLPGVKENTYRQNAVVVIAGGAGGLGFSYSKHLAKTVAARLVWLGRSPQNDSISEKINEIEALGGSVSYLQADLTDGKTIKNAIKTAEQHYGEIHGVVHSAIVLADKTLANMDAGQFRKAYDPKADGSLALAEATAHLNLDFMLFFSSAISFMTSRGQCNYVAGCYFKDAFAQYLNENRNYPVKTLNWGYWGTVGIVSSEDYHRRITSQGHISIQPHEGMDAISRVLGTTLPQAALLKAEPRVFIEMGADLDSPLSYNQANPLFNDNLETVLTRPPMAIEEVLRFQSAFNALENLGGQYLALGFTQMGVFLSQEEAYSFEALCQRLAVIPEYHQLLEAFLDIFVHNGYLTLSNGQYRLTKDPVTCRRDSLDEVAAKLAEKSPEIEERLPLLQACMTNLTKMLTGELDHMKVIFPGGSLDLVSKIYRGNPITDYFNKLMAATAENCIKAHIAAEPQQKFRILEVGAGTGGTSAHVLPVLDAFADQISYTYTDISVKFLAHGEDSYGAGRDYLQFKKFNLEKEPETQGFKASHFDLILGTNVIHATKNMSQTLQRLKRLLRPSGQLLINEFTQCLDYNTLTFGFTHGWWLFDDPEWRIKGSPLISVDQWRRLLSINGFGQTQVIGLPATPSGEVDQQLIFCHSDGIQLQAKQEITITEPKPAITQVETPVETPVVAAPVEPTSTEQSQQQLFDGTVHYIKKVFSEVLRIDRNQIDGNASFDRFGVDSLITMDLNDQFEKELGKLPATLLFEYANVNQLAQYFCENYSEQLKTFIRLPQQAKVLQLGQLFQAKAPQKTVKPVALEQKAPESMPVAAPKPAAQAQSQKQVPVAIIGINGRYPQSENTEQLWQNLVEGRNCLGEIPKDRWNPSHWTGKLSTDGKTRGHVGGFLENIAHFDSLFFNIAPSDATLMDPQERLLLETSWCSLEDAGYHPDKMHDQQVGVFMGCMYQQYPFIADQEQGALLSASSYWSLANRISYSFNFKGPSMAVDTACSSSLTAIHLASMSLAQGECDLALAGGVNLSLHPAKYQRLNELGMLGSGAQSKSLGDGDGLIPGEGVGVVLLKPLAKAIRDQDFIHGVVIGSAVNHGGKTMGFTVPSPAGQAELIEQSIERSGIHPRTISYVELAANGSALGDPIEISGLQTAFRKYTKDRQFCAVGSVKSNLGHLEAASGMAQLTKVLLQMQHGQLVPSINATPLNPKLELATSPFYLQREASNWERPQIEINGALETMPRRAAISSFGAGGAYAHLIIEEFDMTPRVEPSQTQLKELFHGVHLIPLSARDPESLQARVRGLLGYLKKSDGSLRQILDPLCNFAAQCLEVSVDDLDPSAAFGDCGFDPLVFSELTTRINEHFGTTMVPNHVVQSQNLNGLAAQLQSLIQVEAQIVEENIENLAYTLQQGRLAMSERVAWVVSDLKELVEMLEDFLTGKHQYGHRNRVKTGLQTDLLIDDEEGQQFLASLIANGKMDKLARLWVQGLDPNWGLLYEQIPEDLRPQRIPLPTYVFAPKAHWPIASTKQERDVKLEALPVTAPPVVTQPLKAKPEQRKQHLLNQVLSFMSEILKVERNEIDIDDEWSDYGFDSISLATLAQRICTHYKMDLTADFFFGYPEISTCLDELWQTFLDQKGTDAVVMTPVLEHHEAVNHTTNTKYEVDSVAKPTTGPDDIAIIGMAGRLPQSETPDAFWQNLLREKPLIDEIPADRWDWRAYDGDPDTEPNKTRVHWGAFLSDLGAFDHLFFGISPREAELMDPQQKLFLEAAWTAIGDAGYAPSAFSGSRTGVFVGVGVYDYATLVDRNNSELGVYASTGLMVHSILANRVSHLLNLKGPSEIVDTACSSATVAIHRAVRAIVGGECEQALVGGVNALLDPKGFLMLDRAGILSRDGKVRLFHSDSSGYLRGEGVGAVILKPLSKALSDRDHIYAVIKGSAVNHDGKGYSLTAPNPIAQADVVVDALNRAQIDPRTVTYIEAQGTGSPLGDPIEANAFKSAYRQAYQTHGFSFTGQKSCHVGYLKPSIGHLETASGMAALLKLLMSMKHKMLAPTLNVHQQEAARLFENSPFEVLTKTLAWTPTDTHGQALPRRAGLHSFGFGGVNAHLILEEFQGEA